MEHEPFLIQMKETAAYYQKCLYENKAAPSAACRFSDVGGTVLLQHVFRDNARESLGTFVKMAPTPDTADLGLDDGNAILITGMSGRFPKSMNVKEFEDNLYNKVDMLSEPTERWEFSHPELSPRIGVCPDMENFDAQFFGTHYKQAVSMDPTIRKLLECACEALVDAGVNPKSLRNSNTAVYMSASISESEKNLNYDSSTISGYGLTGSSRSHMGNRISFWLGARGPSFSSDNACCGGALTLYQAYNALSRGYCDTAVIGSSCLCLEPALNLHFRWMNMVTLGDKTKSFDQTADGFNRSDGVVVFILQKARDAKRVYAELVYTKTIFTGITEINHDFQMLSPESFKNFLIQFYKEAEVDPAIVEYLEACGTGVNKADYDELMKIDEVFCTKNRKQPIKVGCVKSNLGHCEGVSALVGLAKICLAYHRGEVAGNLHLENPRKDVSGVQEGRIQLLDDHSKISGGYTAINTYSYNGVNSHILLKKYESRQKYKEPIASTLPYLICVSSRIEDTLKLTFKDLESKPLDPRQVALLHNVYGNEIPGFLMRGYKIYSSTPGEKPKCIGEKGEFFDGMNRPIWFVYSGMGSQWPTMGTHLMQFPVFAAAVEHCCKILKPKGLDLMKLLTDPDPETFSNILHSFVAIAAVQIGLTDLLSSFGIKPNNIIGHSVGELGCGYADGCLTAEEMILSAYYRGMVSLETSLIKGSMAAVGLGYATMKPFCPPEIEIACHNGPDSCTVSGPADIMKLFVKTLTERGIFAKEVACSDIAYHSRYIAGAGPSLRKYMSEVIKEPKLRSSRWISSSVPQSRWEETSAKYCSADYLTNNLLNPVLFEESSRLIPDNAITIEIAPHGLLQAILNRSLSSKCKNIALTRRGHSDNVLHLLNAIGSLYIAGLYPKIENLYPTVQFPVPADTPLLSSTLGWMHDEVWPVGCGRRPAPDQGGKYHHILSTKDSDHEYLTGHYINGVNIYPAAAQLVLVWETLARTMNISQKLLSVKFLDVKFHTDVIVPSEEPLELIVYLQTASGNFEITKKGICVTSGTIVACKVFANRNLHYNDGDGVVLDSSDLYRMLVLRGYNYSGEFKSIKSVNDNFTKAQLSFNNNWVTFLDSLFQFEFLSKNNSGISKPKHIETLEIDLNPLNCIKSNMEAVRYAVHGVTSCAGVVIIGLVTEDFNITQTNETVVQKYDFYNYDTEVAQEANALKLHLQTILESIKGNKLNIMEILNSDKDETVKDKLEMAVNDLNTDVKVTITAQYVKVAEIPKDSVVIITHDLTKNAKLIEVLLEKLNENGFILNIEKTPINNNDYKRFQISSLISDPDKKYVLLKKKYDEQPKVIKVDDQNIGLIQKYIEQLSKNETNVLITKSNGTELIEIVKRLRFENQTDARLFVIEDKAAPEFDTKLRLYADQYKKGLAINILRDGTWGVYRFADLDNDKVQSEDTELVATTTGDLESLTWIPTSIPSGSNKTLVKVHYTRVTCSALIKVNSRKLLQNDEDILDRTFGMSFSGTTMKGERVMGLVKNNTISSVVEADPELLWPVPEFWTLKEAATVPRAYVQAHYYLLLKSELPRNLNVLVTGGAGALGQALISICLGAGCQVFTTVDTTSKAKLLLRMFPQLTENNVCISEDTSMLNMITKGTKKGEGCDLIICSVSGDRRLNVMNCLAPLGNFIYIDFHDPDNNVQLGMSFFKIDRSFYAPNFASLFAPDGSPLRKAIRNSIYEGIKAGWVRPLTNIVFGTNQVSRAFRIIAGRRNHGAVLLKLRNSSTKTELEATASWKCDPVGVNIVICDKNVVGVEVAERLVQLGAKKLLLHSGERSGYLEYKMKSWKSNGIDVVLKSQDLKSQDNTNELLSEAANIGSLSSLFVVRYTTNDDVIIRNLDVSSRRYANLGKFVIISLVSDNAVDKISEEICSDRLKIDLPVTSIFSYPPQMSENTLLPLEMLSISLNCTSKYLNHILSRENRMVHVRPSNNAPRTLTTIIADSLGLRNTENLDTNLSLSVLDMGMNYIAELSDSLTENYGKSYDVEELLNLTIGQLLELEETKDYTDTKTNVFSSYFRHYEPENLFGCETLVWMPTVITDGDNILDFYKGEEYLIILPGMDGLKENMYRLCQRLRLRAIVCQFAVQDNSTTVQQLANFFIQKLEAKVGIGSKFYILGYSFGTLVALEMASIFENKGMSGKVFCLDSSPLYLDVVFNSQIRQLSVQDRENQLLAHMYQLITGKKNDITQYLENCTNWDEKIEECLLLMKGVEAPFEYQRLILNTSYKTLQMALNYKQKLKLNCDIVLMKGQGSVGLPKDYGLRDVTQKDVTVYNLACSHISSPYDLRCTDIINRELNLSKEHVDKAIDKLQKLNTSFDGRMIR